MRRGQFAKEFSATLWDAQALFVADAFRHHKSAYVDKLVARSDICMLTEVHGADIGNATWRPPLGTAAWWPAGATAGHAGVGVIARDTFLDLSNEVTLEVIWPGRVMKLKLRGPNGSLDSIVSYFHTGARVTEHDLHGVDPSLRDHINSFPALRAHLRNRIARKLSPHNVSLAYFFWGDFNYVNSPQDRTALNNNEHSGRRGAGEKTHFQATAGRPFALHDMYQSEYTHASISSGAKLGRIYCNQHVSEQIDRSLRASALEWRPELLAHRAVFFARSSPQRAQEADRGIPERAFRHDDFPRLLALDYFRKVEEQPEASPIATLHMYKSSIKEVARRLDESMGTPPPATSFEDRLGVAMKFIRSVEKGAVGEISSCIIRYPHLKSLVDNPYATTGHLSRRLCRVRDRAVELARDHALDELNKSHADLASLNPQRCLQARQQNTT